MQTVFDGDLKVPSTLQASVLTAASKAPRNDACSLSVRARLDVLAGQERHCRRRLSASRSAYGVWVYGDDSGNEVNIRFMDATADFQANGPPMRLVRMALSDVPAAAGRGGGANLGPWGGATMGRFITPSDLTTLLLLDFTAGPSHHQGTVLMEAARRDLRGSRPI